MVLREFNDCLYYWGLCLRDATGNYRITGRVDDVVIVSGDNPGTAPIENAINEHPKVAESAVVGFPHDVKGSALYAYVILFDDIEPTDALKEEVRLKFQKLLGLLQNPTRSSL